MERNRSKWGGMRSESGASCNMSLLQTGCSLKTPTGCFINVRPSAALNFLWLLSLFQDKESNIGFGRAKMNEINFKSEITVERSQNTKPDTILLQKSFPSFPQLISPLLQSRYV